MKFIKKTLAKIQNNICYLLGCGYPVAVKHGNTIRQNNSFSRHYHINDFTKLDFPQKQIYRFFDLADDQLILMPSTDNEDEDEIQGILLSVAVKSCNKNSLKNSFHENSFADSFSSYNKQLIITNIPVDLKDHKKNFELTCYLTGYINEFTNEIEISTYGRAVDLIFHYKFITFDEYLKHAEKVSVTFEN